MDNYNYPAGSDTKDAPWNQEEPNAKEFEVTISQTLSKNVIVSTTDYDEEEDWDDDMGKCTTVDTSNTDWQKAYQNNHETIVDLLCECGKMARELYDMRKDQANTPENRREMKRLQYIMNECIEWNLDEYEVVQ